MDAARLLAGNLALAASVAPWLGRELTIAAVVAAAALLILAAALLYRWHRRRAWRHRPRRVLDKAQEIKERLRRRLAEPAEAFAASAFPGPTVGASEAFEGDLAEATRQVLPEAGWRCGAAKHLLRKRINGHTPNGAANGAEAAQWRQLGALAFLNDTHDAVMAYSRAAELAPDNPDLQMLLGVLHLRTGGLEAAETAFRRQMELASIQDGGEAARYRAGTMLGDVLLAKGARAEALAAYEAARKEALALAEREPGNPRWQRDASVMHDRVGDALLADGQIDLALESFRRSLEMAEALAQGNAASANLQRDLSVAHDRIGEALDLKGDLDGALASFRRSLEHAEAVVRLEPDRPEWRWDVSVSLDRVGDALSAKGKSNEALSAYRQSLEIAGTLAADDPTRLEWQRDVAVTCHKLGTLEAQCGHEAEAREALEQGKAIIARLAEIARYRAQWRADLSKFDAALRSLGS